MSTLDSQQIMSKSYLSTETLQALGPVGKNAPRPKAQAAVKVKAERKVHLPLSLVNSRD